MFGKQLCYRGTFTSELAQRPYVSVSVENLEWVMKEEYRVRSAARSAAAAII